jgi:hypothetical protein
MKIRRQLIQETQQYKGSKIEEKIQEYEILESCIPYLTQAGSETRKKIRNDDNVSIVLSEAISNLLVLNNYSNNHLQSCIV